MMIDILPVITETSLDLAAKNWFTFRVPTGQNKNRLRKEIAARFKVDVLAIKTLVVKGKQKKSLKNRRIIKAEDWKKVIVKVKEGQKIEAFDIGGSK